MRKIIFGLIVIVFAVLIIWGMTKPSVNNSISMNNSKDIMEAYMENKSADASLLSLFNTSPIPDITVNHDLEDDPASYIWNTIQEAIDDANEGDVIYVRNGTYRENLAINKPLSLIGEDNNSTIIDGGYEGDAVHIKANNVRLSGFKIINGRSRLYSATIIRGAAAVSSFTWTPENFGGFFYDIENGAGNETLRASVRGRGIERGGLTYTTTPQEINFKYSPFGSYEVMGFMGERFFAGYTSNSSISGKKVINALESGQLHKILLNEGDEHTIIEDGNLNLKEGYALRLKAASSGDVRVSLLKDGNEIDSGKAIKRNETYIYSKWSGKISDLPVIAVHIDSFFREKETNTTVVKGIFQISETFNGLAIGDRYGNMAISQVSLDGISMKNYYPVRLSRNSTTFVTENLGFKIAGSDALRFYPYIIKIYSSDVRGRAARRQEAQTWDADSFSGFYYNPDLDIKPEKLYISEIPGRTVEKGSLMYESRVTPEYFNIYTHKGILIEGKANYSVIGLGGKTYVAVGGKSNKTARILIDHGESLNNTKMMVSDETWDMGEGYTLTAQSVYSWASPSPPDRKIWIKNKNGNYIGQARLTLRQDDMILKNETIPEGGAFIYSTNLSDETNIPVFVTYLDEVWEGTTMDHAVLRYTWLMSQDVKEIKRGDIFNSLEVVNVTSEEIVFKNSRPIFLSRSSTIPLIGDIKIRVADSSELKYYPVVTGVSGGEESAGIAIEGSENVIISGNNILNNYCGVRLISTKGTLLAGNNLSNGGYGIYMSSSGGNILVNNSMTDNLYNFGVFGYGSDFDNRIDTSNLVDGKPVYYIKDSENAVFGASTSAGTFYCINCVNITVKDMEFNNNGAGIFFWNTTRSRIQNVNSSYNYYGIYLMSSSNNTLNDNIVSNDISQYHIQKVMNQYLYFMLPQRPGIHMSSSNNNILTGNIISYGGISLYASSSNMLDGNRYFYSNFGVIEDDQSKNNVIKNT